MELRATEPFDLRQSLAVLARSPCCADDVRCRDDRLVTGGYADGYPYVVTVREGVGNRLVGEVEWLESSGDERIVADAVGAFLSLADDLGPLYAAADEDAVFGPVVEELWGYHQVRFPSPYAAAVWAALSKRTPTTVARAQKRDLVAACGRMVDRDGGDRLALFPAPEMVRARSEAVGSLLDGTKARTVLAATEAFAEEPLSTLPTSRLVSRLEDLWGFDARMAEFVALRGFGRMERPPADEYELRSTVGDLYGHGDDPTAEALDRLADRYEPLSGYWAHYIDVWAARRDEDLVIDR
ncbi:DNA-3-methyladenine glycosylase family protein [Halomarina litorea]|uniref:DNA-3-methyladenine glycosylase family protein n=1 Tax=Halomarina litorea TaxID=2961595 RepID=UPI0020C3A943|nr:hypothetical protein [Halomarina sp. BCD28]